MLLTPPPHAEASSSTNKQRGVSVTPAGPRSIAPVPTEMPVDVLYKKPWRFSPRFEFMIGADPEMIHESGPDHGTFWGISSVLDFMFWPKKNAGWYLLAWNGDGDSCAAASKAWTGVVFDECRPRLAQRNRGAGDRGV